MTKAQQKRGFTKLTMGGRKRPLYFGLVTFMDIEEQFPGITIEDVTERLNNIQNVQNFKLLFTLIWSGLYNGAVQSGEEFDLDLRGVSFMVDDMDEEQLTHIFETLAESQFFGKESNDGNGDNDAPSGNKKK